MMAETIYADFLHSEERYGQVKTFLGIIRERLHVLNITTNRSLFSPPTSNDKSIKGSTSIPTYNDKMTRILLSLCDCHDVKFHQLGEFLKRGGDPNGVIDHTGDAPLHRLIRIGASADCVELLLSWGANPKAINQKGRTPLMLICDSEDTSAGRLHITRLLLKSYHKAEVNAFDHGGRSAAIFAVSNNNIWILRELLLAGASATLRKSNHDVDYSSSGKSDMSNNGIIGGYRSLLETARFCREIAVEPIREPTLDDYMIDVTTETTTTASSSNDTSNRSDGTDSANGNGEDMVDSEHTNRSHDGNSSTRDDDLVSTTSFTSSNKSNRGGYLKGGRRIPLGKRLSKHSLSHRWIDHKDSSIVKTRTLSEGKSCDYGSTSAVYWLSLRYRHFPEEVCYRMILQQQEYEEREQHNEELRSKRLAEMKALDGIGKKSDATMVGSTLGLIIDNHDSEDGQGLKEGGPMSVKSGGRGRGGWVVGRRSTVRFAASDEIRVVDVGPGQGDDDEVSHGTSAAGGGGANSIESSVAVTTGTVTEGGGSVTRSAKTPGLRGILRYGGTSKRPNTTSRSGLKSEKATTVTTTVTINNTTRKLNLPPGGPPTFSNKNIAPPSTPLPFTTNKTTTSTTTKSNKRFNFGWVISAAKINESSTDSVNEVDGEKEDAVWRIGHRRRLDARKAARKQVTLHFFSTIHHLYNKHNAARDDLAAAAAHEEMFVARLARAKALDGVHNENPYHGKKAPKLTGTDEMERMVRQQHEEHLKQIKEAQVARENAVVAAFQPPPPPVQTEVKTEAGPEDWARVWNEAKPKRIAEAFETTMASLQEKIQAPRTALPTYIAPGTATALLLKRKEKRVLKMMTADVDAQTKHERKFRRRTKTIQKRLSAERKANQQQQEAEFSKDERVHVNRPVVSNLNYKVPTTDDKNHASDRRDDDQGGRREGEAKGMKGMQIRGMDEAWYTPAEVNEYKQALSKTALKLGISFDPHGRAKKGTYVAPKDTDRNIFDPLSSDSDEDGKDDDHDDEEEEEDRPGRKVKFSVSDGKDSNHDERRTLPSALANGPRTSLNNPTSLVQQRLQMTFTDGASQQDPPIRRVASSRTVAVAPPSPQMAGHNGGLTSPTAGTSAGRGMMSPSRAILVGSRSDRRAALPEVSELPETMSPDSTRSDSPPHPRRKEAPSTTTTNTTAAAAAAAAAEEKEERSTPVFVPKGLGKTTSRVMGMR